MSDNYISYMSDNDTSYICQIMIHHVKRVSGIISDTSELMGCLMSAVQALIVDL